MIQDASRVPSIAVRSVMNCSFVYNSTLKSCTVFENVFAMIPCTKTNSKVLQYISAAAQSKGAIFGFFRPQLFTYSTNVPGYMRTVNTWVFGQ